MKALQKFLILTFIMSLVACTQDETEHKNIPTKSISEGIISKSENGEISLKENKKSEKFIPDTEYLDSKIASATEKEKNKIISKLSPESKAFIERATMKTDSMANYLDILMIEAKKEPINITTLTLFEADFYAIKKRFEADQMALRKENLTDYKIIYSIIAQDMNDKIRGKFIEFKSILKKKNIRPYQIRLKQIKIN